MARPQSGKADAAASAQPLAPEVADQLSALKKDAAALFLKKDFNKAVETYDQATKLLPEGAVAEKNDLLFKKAGCLMGLKRYKDAVNECSSILEAQPDSIAALKQRSKAYEQMNFHTKALADIQAINKTEAATAETHVIEQRLKNVIAARSKLATSSDSPSRSRAASATQQPQSNPYFITIRATHGSDTKTMHASLLVSYAELYEAIKAKFAEVGPFCLKYTDKEGDAVTICSRMDIQSHLGDIVTAFQKQNMHGPRLQAHQLPPMKIEVVACAQAEVPVPPADEIQAMQGAKKTDAEQVEDEPWLLRFAKLFSEVTSIDPAAHHENINLGHDIMTKAMEASVANEDADPMFKQAGDHFRDATTATLIQWGNVHVVKAEKHAQALLRSGKEISKSDLDMMMNEYKETEKKINQALGFKADSWEAVGSLGQLEWERLKAKLGYIVPSLQSLEEPSTEGKTPEQVAADSQAAVTEAVRKALSKVNAKSVKSAQGHLDKANEWFGKALVLAKASDAKEEEGSEKLSEEQQQQAKLASPTGNMLIMHGNVLYEWSQVLAAVGSPWKPQLDEAVAKFREAGASEAEIRSALKNHTHAEELDLGPEPEPAAELPQAPAAAPAAPVAEEPKTAKGLPSLPAKKKKGEK